MKHRDVSYTVEEARPGYWRWAIHTEASLTLFGEAKHKSREAAIEACIEEIDDTLAQSTEPTLVPADRSSPLS